MRIIIAAVGKMRRGPERELFESYRARISWSLDVREIASKKHADMDRVIAEEGRLLTDALPERAESHAIALDGGGRTMSSEKLAERLGQWRDEGSGASFMIGGAYGLSESALARAETVLSLGPMTWPHMMVRAMLAEQIYRCHQILAGHPYHHG